MAQSQLDLLRLEGSPRDIGYSHGKQGGERIRSFLEIIVKHGIESIPDFTREKALSHAKRYVPFIEDYAPDLAEEIRGIAEGANIQLEEAYLLQLRAELTQLTIENESTPEGCTSFALPSSMTEDGEVCIGQNVDLSPFYKDFGVMLHIKPDKGPAILCYSQIGTVAHAGVNSAGIGLALNAVYSSDWRPGVPRPVLYRLILEQGITSEALKVFIDAVKFEKRPKDKLENSKFRESRLRQLVYTCEGKVSLGKLKEFLTDHERYPTAICTHAEGNPWNFMTIASIIAQPADGIMHVSLGQGCKNEYVKYSLYNVSGKVGQNSEKKVLV